MKALAMISEDYGSIFVEFGRPISLHDFCGSRGVSRVPHTLYPKSVVCVCWRCLTLSPVETSR